MSLGARTAALTILALIAFASNSLLTRFALGAGQIGAAMFAAVRLASGAVMLVLIVRSRAGNWLALRGSSVTGPLALLAYAVPFSFAYLRIGAAVGALVLFGVVQLTMIGYGLVRGERPSSLAWLGILLATAGLASLTIRSATRPDPFGLLLMTVAGVAWGVYSIAGRSASDPLAANARSFLWSSPIAIALAALTTEAATTTPNGLLLAVISGAVTSGIGYAIWYRALQGLTVTRAAVAQLTVPVIAAAAAALLLREPLTARLVFSGSAVLGGVALVLVARTRQARN